MLKDFITMIITRLADTGVPVYLADCVPEGAACPYITLAAAAPLGSASGTMSLTVWHTTNAGRITLAEEISALLPARGLHLEMSGGGAVLCGGTASFLRESPLLGIRMVWKLRFFPAG